LAVKGGLDLAYCEGYAFAAGFPMPIHHGWCVDSKGAAVDVTWRTPLAFRGVVLAQHHITAAPHGVAEGDDNLAGLAMQAIARDAVVSGHAVLPWMMRGRLPRFQGFQAAHPTAEWYA
jgi:hypothetical protein